MHIDDDWAPGWPAFSQDEIDAVSSVLRSGRVNYWTGTHGRSFEREFAAYCSTSHGVALANGTVALELGLRALGIGPGDDVVVTARSFFASASAIVAVGAQPIFADVDPDSQNITPETIDAALTPDTRAVIAVHLAGWPCDMVRIMEYCNERKVAVVEDCAQAHGAALAEKRVGSFGNVAAFSFCQDKIMSTGGEGGMLLTDDDVLFEEAWSYKDHGKSLAKTRREDHPPGFRWLHDSFGTNWRMTEMQATLGRIQLTKLEGWLETRSRNATLLHNVLEGEAALSLPRPPGGIKHAWYKYCCFVEPTALKSGWNRDRILADVAARGGVCHSGSCPEIYLERAFDGSSSRPVERLPVARALGETSLMMLVDPCQTADTIIRAGETLRTVLRDARR